MVVEKKEYIMNLVAIIGIIAPILSIVSFVPQVYKCWKTKRTKDISFPTYILFATGALLWFTYGILKGDFSIIFTNSFLAVLTFLIILMKLRYG